MRVLACITLICWGIGGQAQEDSLPQKIMTAEKKVVDAFTSLREFHFGLLGEIGEPKEEPYFRLDSIFREMKQTADAAIIERMHFDSIQSSLPDLQRRALADRKITVLSELAVQNNQSSNLYQSTCASFGVMRTDKYRLIEKVGKYTASMQDTLELQGKMIGDAKRALDVKYPAKSGKEYFAKYAPVSEMESLFKKMEGNIVQLENLQSRIEDSNGALYYWSGPNILPRQEVAVGDQIIVQCIMLNNDFKKYNQAFYEGIR